MGEKRNAYRILVGKPEGEIPLGRPRRRWVDSIVTWMARALLRNGPINTPRPNTHKATIKDVPQGRNVIARC
jgi:hypothetical protein